MSDHANKDADFKYYIGSRTPGRQNLKLSQLLRVNQPFSTPLYTTHQAMNVRNVSGSVAANHALKAAHWKPPLSLGNLTISVLMTVYIDVSAKNKTTKLRSRVRMKQCKALGILMHREQRVLAKQKEDTHTDMNVPGKKNNVTRVMIFIETVSSLVFIAN